MFTGYIKLFSPVSVDAQLHAVRQHSVVGVVLASAGAPCGTDGQTLAAQDAASMAGGCAKVFSEKTPRAFARARPSPVRARISSNSARPPKTVSISRPCGVVVSAQVSDDDLNVAPALAMASRMLSKSRVERASLSRHVTTTVSPSPSVLISFASCGLSDRAPLIYGCSKG